MDKDKLKRIFPDYVSPSETKRSREAELSAYQREGARQQKIHEREMRVRYRTDGRLIATILNTAIDILVQSDDYSRARPLEVRSGFLLRSSVQAHWVVGEKRTEEVAPCPRGRYEDTDPTRYVTVISTKFVTDEHNLGLGPATGTTVYPIDRNNMGMFSAAKNQHEHPYRYFEVFSYAFERAGISYQDLVGE